MKLDFFLSPLQGHFELSLLAFRALSMNGGSTFSAVQVKESEKFSVSVGGDNCSNYSLKANMKICYLRCRFNKKVRT